MSRPTTIDELRLACEQLGLPLDLLRVNIGVDSGKPKCFGIYREPDTLEFVVYKNGSDGTRKVRYRGHDEAEAVSILWDKIGEIARLARKPAPVETMRREAAPPRGEPRPVREDVQDEPYVLVEQNSGPVRHRRRRSPDWGTVTHHAAIALLAILFAALIAVMCSAFFEMLAGTLERAERQSRSGGYRPGYYQVDGEYYYHTAGYDWYLYNAVLNEWLAYDVPDDWYDPGAYDWDYYGSEWDYGADNGYLYFDDWYQDEYGHDWSRDYGYSEDWTDDWDADTDYDTGWSDDYNWDSDWDSSSDYDSGYDGDSDWSWDSGSSWDYDYDSDYDYDYDSGSSWDSDWDSGYDWDSDW